MSALVASIDLALGLAFAADPDLGEVAARPPLVDPEVAAAGALSSRCGRSQYQSMSPMWPLRQARTKRTGTTGCDFLRVVDELALVESGAMDQPARAGLARRTPSMTPWVMNHSGNCQQVMPVFWGRGRVVVVGRRGVEASGSETGAAP